MSDTPFHVVGGAFVTHQTQPGDGFANMLRQRNPAETATAKPLGSRRRKLWEVSHKFHCPIVGVCFEVDHLRTTMAKVMHFPRDTTDFVLHTTAVGACETRTLLAELLQKNMEKRFEVPIRRFAAAKNSEALRALWHEATRTGSEIPGALWASWTHPACDALIEQEIYGDIHMIQHQVGTGTRADLTALKTLKAENGQLHKQLQDARREAETLRTEKTNTTQLLNQRISELLVELAGKDAWLANQTGQFETLRQSLPDLKDRQTLARRASDADARALALTAHAAELEEKVEHLQDLARHAETTINHLLAAGNQAAEPASPPKQDESAALAGKCILCVGGRSGAVDGYRQIVEQRGGRFLHHDGGLEESLHRIDAALLAADLVVCQAGCISHNAYWRVKEQCKRTGKQCVFVKSAGLSSFGRLVSEACEGAAVTSGDNPSTLAASLS